MPKLPDPTLFSQSGGAVAPASPNPPTGGEGGQKAMPADVRPSPFRLIGPLIVVLFVAAIGFVVTRFLVLPRLKKSAPVTITYWGLWESPDIIASAIAKFEAANPTVKITYQMQSKTDYRQRLQSALARGEGPDIMRIHATWTPMFVDELDSATADEFSADEFRQTFYQVAVNDLIRNNAVVAVPLMIDGLGLYVNNQIFTATTSAVPTNWDELRKTAFALTVRDRRGQITQAGVAMGTTSNVAHWPDILAALMLQNSVDLTKPDTTVDAKGRNLGADALRFYTIFTTEDRTWDDTLPPDIIAFANGKAAMILAPSWEAHAIRQMSPKLDFSIYPIPQLSSQRKVTWASYWVEGVSKNSKHKKEAWKFLKYLSSKESLQMMYAEASKTRAFGEIYPRRDMAGSLQDAKYVGVFVGGAPDATSWYLSSGTFDNGINDEIISYYQSAINAISSQQRIAPESAIATAAKGVQQVLGKYKVR